MGDNAGPDIILYTDLFIGLLKIKNYHIMLSCSAILFLHFLTSHKFVFKNRTAFSQGIWFWFLSWLLRWLSSNFLDFQPWSECHPSFEAHVSNWSRMCHHDIFFRIFLLFLAWCSFLFLDHFNWVHCFGEFHWISFGYRGSQRVDLLKVSEWFHLLLEIVGFSLLYKG